MAYVIERESNSGPGTRGCSGVPACAAVRRLHVTTWARNCEMIGFRPSDFEFEERMVNVTRSTVYLSAKYHPSGKAGWLTKPNPKNGDWLRFTISKQMCDALRLHIKQYDLGPDDLLFPLWMFAFVRPAAIRAISAGESCENALAPLVSKTGITYESLLARGSEGSWPARRIHRL